MEDGGLEGKASVFPTSSSSLFRRWLRHALSLRTGCKGACVLVGGLGVNRGAGGLRRVNRKAGWSRLKGGFGVNR